MKKRCALISVLFIFLLQGSVIAQSANTPWNTQFVENRHSVGEFNTLVLDAQGNPHICYRDDTDSFLKYASINGGAWYTLSVGQTGYGTSPSLALDAEGNPNICYHDYTDSSLKYVYINGTKWTRQIAAAEDCDSPSLVLDSKGNPHIAYITHKWTGDFGEYYLKYASRDGDVWKIITIDSSNYSISLPSLKLDSSDNPHVAYTYSYPLHYETEMIGVKYASWNGTDWVIQIVDKNGQEVSLALDSHDAPHISYSYVGSGLKYASWTGAGWSIQKVVDFGIMSCLVLDSEDKPHIGFIIGWDNSNLTYARWSNNGWDISSIEELCDARHTYPGTVSLALDSAGNPHLSYRVERGLDASNLKYAFSTIAPSLKENGEPWNIAGIIVVATIIIATVTLTLSRFFKKK
jgi:hypothetical protein